MIKIPGALIITKNSAETLENCLLSVKDFVSEILVIDSNSTDNTLDILKKYDIKILQFSTNDLGKKRSFGLRQIKSDWVLMLDADEIISLALKLELQSLIKKKRLMDGYLIPYQNHFINKKINYGGENYEMLRLFRKDKVLIKPALIHEKVKLKTKRLGRLNGKIYHYSYRNFRQIYSKFTDYAKREVQQKIKKGEKSSFRKIFLYPLHIFWARFIKDKGYKDGLWRLPLDIGFAYMEWLTYVLLMIGNIKYIPTQGRDSDRIVGKKEKIKIAFIVVEYKTKASEKRRLNREINKIKNKKDKTYWIDNTENRQGFAFGVNKGINKGLKGKCNLFVVLNPDISVKNISRRQLTSPGKYFDLWGGVMKQGNKIYYGGEIDPWRLSGGLIEEKPKKQYAKCDFVTGSLMIIKKELIDTIGYLDEKYFMYYEDVDYCTRARKTGFRIGVDTKIIYQHFENSRKNKQKSKLLAKSRWRFFWKYANWRQKIREIIRFSITQFIKL